MKNIIKKIPMQLLMAPLLVAGFSSGDAYAQSFCFASAGSYYEQVYCELQARGEAKTLPPFYQFKRNDARTQALLLKRPAARIGIDLPMPTSAAAKSTVATAPSLKPRTSTPASVKPGSQQPASKTSTPQQEGTLSTSTGVSSKNLLHSSGCQLNAEEMRCGERRFLLTGNRRNQRLAQGVLDADNKMALPVYDGKVTDQVAVENYLAEAYRQYIEKMHEIGLGGVTMTYGKFYFLFFDLQEKGLNFSQRFETMYGFLKKDKATMGVSETMVADKDLTTEDCDALAEHMWVCSRAGRNYLYLAQSD